jgi:urease accessory protein
MIARDGAGRRASGAKPACMVAGAEAQSVPRPDTSRDGAVRWRASLTLDLARRGARTVLAHRTHAGPLRVQRAFYPEADVPHIYLLHPPGGVVGGDELDIRVRCGPGAHALLTTPAAHKFYRSDGPIAVQCVALMLEDGAGLEWLPQETLVFAGARAGAHTRIQLADRARFIGLEVVALGRPACGEVFDRGRFLQTAELWSRDRPVSVERLRLEGGGRLLGAPWGLAGFNTLGTLLAWPGDGAFVDAARRALAAAGTVRGGVTLVDGLLVCRVLGAWAEPVKAALIAVWEALRPGLLQRPACLPRIWRT